MKQTLFALCVLLLLLGMSRARAHPGSGIVADRQGNIYFVDTGSGVWKIDRDGALVRVPGPAYHWMAIDVNDVFKNVALPHFSSGDATVTGAGADPTLLLSSDFPVAVGRDSCLYYPWLGKGEQVQIFRLAPSGTTSVLATLPAKTESGPLRWVNGMAVAPDGSVYYTEHRAVRKISPQGQQTTVVDNVRLSGCDPVPGVEPEVGPYLRGLDVDAQGNVYVAAAGCRALLKITPEKRVTTLLRTSGPWSPTGVVLRGSDVFVLEYLHTASDNRREWLPRVRKVTADGHAVTVAAIDR